MDELDQLVAADLADEQGNRRLAAALRAIPRVWDPHRFTYADRLTFAPPLSPQADGDGFGDGDGARSGANGDGWGHGDEGDGRDDRGDGFGNGYGHDCGDGCGSGYPL